MYSRHYARYTCHREVAPSHAVRDTGAIISTPRLENRIRVARAERALSQDALARLVGVTRQTISSIETNQYVPSALLAFLLARALDKRVDELFTLTGDEP